MPKITSNRAETVAAGELSASDEKELIELIQEKTAQTVLFISEGFRVEMNECWFVAAKLNDGNFALHYQPMNINEFGNYEFSADFPLDVYFPFSEVEANARLCIALDCEEDYWSNIHIQQMELKDELGNAAKIEKRDMRVKYVRYQVVIQGVPIEEAEVIAALTHH